MTIKYRKRDEKTPYDPAGLKGYHVSRNLIQIKSQKINTAWLVCQTDVFAEAFSQEVKTNKPLDEPTLNKTGKVNIKLDSEKVSQACQNFLHGCVFQLNAGNMTHYLSDHPGIKLNSNTAVPVCSDGGYRLDEPFTHKGKY